MDFLTEVNVDLVKVLKRFLKSLNLDNKRPGDDKRNVYSISLVPIEDLLSNIFFDLCILVQQSLYLETNG